MSHHQNKNSHYKDKTVSVNWTIRNKSLWNLNQNTTIFIQENAYENIICIMLPFCSGQGLFQPITHNHKATPDWVHDKELEDHQRPGSLKHKDQHRKFHIHFTILWDLNGNFRDFPSQIYQVQIQHASMRTISPLQWLMIIPIYLMFVFHTPTL